MHCMAPFRGGQISAIRFVCTTDNGSGQILASASYDDTIKLYIDDPSEDWYCFSTLSGHKSTVWSLAWSPQGSYLASSSDDLTIRIWKRVEEHTWQSVMELKGHQRSIYSISWGVGKRMSESLGWLATTGGDGKINVWDITVCSKRIPRCIELTSILRNRLARKILWLRDYSPAYLELMILVISIRSPGALARTMQTCLPRLVMMAQSKYGG
jgi:WD40 repeat protein